MLNSSFGKQVQFVTDAQQRVPTPKDGKMDSPGAQDEY